MRKSKQSRRVIPLPKVQGRIPLADIERAVREVAEARRRAQAAKARTPKSKPRAAAS